jgi:hypothetical protein
MNKGAKLIDCFLCDDVRQEISGKSTFVGVYGADVIIPVVPYILPQLYIVSKWNVSSGLFKEIAFRLVSPSGNQIGPVRANAPATVKGTRLTMNLALIPFQIQTLGRYQFYIKIDDQPEKMIDEFEVKLAASQHANFNGN